MTTPSTTTQVPADLAIVDVANGHRNGGRCDGSAGGWYRSGASGCQVGAGSQIACSVAAGFLTASAAAGQTAEADPMPSERKRFEAKQVSLCA